VEGLRRTVAKNNWRGIGVDIDHSICDSGPVWDAPMQQFCERVAWECGVSSAEVWGLWRNMNDDIYLTSGGVHPSKYHRMGMRIASKYGLDFERARQWVGEMRRQIYSAVPELYPKTRETLAILREVGLLRIFVTHAPVGLTSMRLRTWGFEEIPAFSESTLRQKDGATWVNAVAKLGLKPQEMIAVGDSWPGDIEAAGKAGITARVWIRPKWKILEGKCKKEEVPTIEDIGQLVQAIIDNFG